jgi:hypothetical protein
VHDTDRMEPAPIREHARGELVGDHV